MTTDIITRIHFPEIHSSANSQMIFLTDYNGNLSTTTLMMMKTIRVLKKITYYPNDDSDGGIDDKNINPHTTGLDYCNYNDEYTMEYQASSPIIYVNNQSCRLQARGM